MAPNRVVALTAPLIAPLAGAFAAWLSHSFPGLEVPEDAVEEVFLGVAALVFGLAFQFNHNRYKWDELIERQSAETAPATDPLIDAVQDDRRRRGRAPVRNWSSTTRTWTSTPTRTSRSRSKTRSSSRPPRPRCNPMALSARTLVKLGVDKRTAQAHAPFLAAAMRECDITTKARAEMFLAQLFHESIMLSTFEEIASGAAYEGRKDLGNVQRGDGVRFKGRGPIQVTGRANYKWMSDKLGADFIAQPKLLATARYGYRAAAAVLDAREPQRQGRQGRLRRRHPLDQRRRDVERAFPAGAARGVARAHPHGGCAARPRVPAPRRQGRRRGRAHPPALLHPVADDGQGLPRRQAPQVRRRDREGAQAVPDRARAQARRALRARELRGARQGGAAQEARRQRQPTPTPTTPVAHKPKPQTKPTKPAPDKRPVPPPPVR